MSYVIPPFSVPYDCLRSTSDDSPVDAAVHAFGRQLPVDTRCREEIIDQLVDLTPYLDGIASCVGRKGDDIRINVTGHTNPGRGQEEGWAGEFLQVTVSVVTPAMGATLETEAEADRAAADVESLADPGAGGPVKSAGAEHPPTPEPQPERPEPEPDFGVKYDDPEA